MGAASSVTRVLDAVRSLARLDGWSNQWSRLGTDLDPTTHTVFSRQVIGDGVLSALFHGDDICKLICSIPVKDALRRGWGEDKFPELDFNTRGYTALGKIHEAAVLARAFGGSVVVVGADDGAPAHVPLNLAAAGPVQHLTVYDRRRVERLRGANPSLAEADLFRISPLYGPSVEVHVSRLLVFGGELTAGEEREAISGWEDSCLQAVYNIVRAFNDGFLSANRMMVDASQGVLKLRGLINAIAGGNKQDIETRAQLIALTRSVARVTMLDAEGESFEKIATSFAGVPDILDRLANRLSAATGIPVTRLMGQAPAGLNATGDNDLRSWYDNVESYRETSIEPQCKKLLEIAKIDRPLKFPSLWQETGKEKAEREVIESTRDKNYVDAGVVLADEVLGNVRKIYPFADPSLRSTSTAGFELAPTDAARVVKVNEARANLGLPPLDGPEGQLSLAEYGAMLEGKGAPTPGAPPLPALPAALPVAGEDDEAAEPQAPDGPLALAQAMNAYRDATTGQLGLAKCEHGHSNVCRKCGIERDRGFEVDDKGVPLLRDGRPVFRIQWRAIGGGPPSAPAT